MFDENHTPAINENSINRLTVTDGMDNVDGINGTDGTDGTNGIDNVNCTVNTIGVNRIYECKKGPGRAMAGRSFFCIFQNNDKTAFVMRILLILLILLI